MKHSRDTDPILFRYFTITASLLLATGLMLLSAGCVNNPTEAEDFVREPVLFAFIENGAPVDTITLEWTGAYNRFYDRALLGIVSAEIVMFPVRDQNFAAVDTAANPGLVLRFLHASGRDGYGEYVPANPAYLPNGRWTYRIEAREPDLGVDLWAETVVPDSFSYFTAFKSEPFTPVEIDSMTLTREDDEIFVNWTECADARGFVLGIIAQSDPQNLIPLDPEWDPNNPDDAIDDWELTRHGWTFARYDQRTLTVAWIFFEWAGWNTLYINAASESYYQYMLSLINASDPSWKQNPDFNVHGGLGVFGAFYQHDFHIFLERVQL